MQVQGHMVLYFQVLLCPYLVQSIVGLQFSIKRDIPFIKTALVENKGPKSVKSL